MSKPATILIVDADEGFRESIANHLLVHGIEKIEMASSIKEAVKKISRISFDIVLADLFMPHMDGLHLAQKFQDQMPKTKFILLIDDPALSRDLQERLDFPTILKSFVQQIMSEVLNYN